MHNIIHERLQVLPPSARALVYGHDGWIVGGCTKYILGINDDIPKDIDIIVPFYEWGRACLIIPRGTLSNSFGGHKLTDQIAYVDGSKIAIDIDVWCGDVGWFLAHSKLFDGYAVHVTTHSILLRSYGLQKEKHHGRN